MFHELRMPNSQRRIIAVSYLCGASLEYAKRWGLETNVTYSNSWRIKEAFSDPLIAFYDRCIGFPVNVKARKKRKLRNSAHFYLAYNGVDIERKGLVTSCDIKDEIIKVLDEDIYSPITGSIKPEDFRRHRRDYCIGYLLEKVVCGKFAYILSKELMLKIMREIYQDKTWPDRDELKNLFMSTTRNGGRSVLETLPTFKKLLETVRRLDPTEAELIKNRYGLDDIAEPMKLREIRDSEGLPPSTACRKEKGAIEKLKSLFAASSS